MDKYSSCHTCSLRQAGAMAVTVCYPCRERDQRSHFCIAVNDGGRLHPFLAADDEGSIHSYLAKLATEGQRAVMLTWNSEQYCYLGS